MRALTDAQWAILQPLLPPRKRTGRPRAADRRTLDAILYVLRTGCAWRGCPLGSIPETYGDAATAAESATALATDANGLPLGMLTTSAGIGEVRIAAATLATITVPQEKRQPRSRPRQLIADRGYDSQALRQPLHARRIRIALRRVDSGEGRSDTLPTGG